MQVFAQSKTLAEKEFHLQTIFHRLEAAFELLPGTVILEIRPRNHKYEYILPPAEMRKSIPRKVIIAESLYDLCQQFGKQSSAALAGVLAHELAHYKSDTPSGFAGQANAVKQEEIKADQLGFRMAYQAGYDSFQIAPALFKKIYQTYQLPHTSNLYPSYNERLSSIAAQAHLIKKEAEWFELATIFYLLQHYQVAQTYLIALQQNFASAEVRNNLGLCFLRQAHFNPQITEFALPFEWDARNRLLNATIREEWETEASKPLLTKAQLQFESALRLDPNYVPAHINLACVHFLLGYPELAIRQINHLQTIRKKIPPQAALIRGISQVKLGHIKEAAIDFEQVKKENSYESKMNFAMYDRLSKGTFYYFWDRLAGIWTNPVPLFSKKTKLVKETHIGKVSLHFPYPYTTIPSPETAIVQSSRQADAQLYQIQVGTQWHRIAQTLPGKIYKTRQRKSAYTGQSSSLLEKEYGLPDRQHYSITAEFWVYNQAHTIFKIQNHQVTGWFIFD
ncbi:hypothetical protein [Siphonobacter sp. SORGH_AS_1065]|uniref:hypothetical protein n=1 Tax=Siphonobacter sp. SORGH_AS_1065 TaxID=3041795 RepID=UPI00278AE2EF|nr:hypothetical protein [Siphonobacter sp. SORGH_AS_1065]MDQ1089778.1 tetratricopeptide (TPR) repeat protein [Siphonobacter sp. SORGH_AS_1065]